MIAELRIYRVVPLVALLTVGLAGGVVALAHRSGDDQFIQDQRHPPKLRATEVARVVRSAPDPATGKGSGVAATCTRRGSGLLGNPWTCAVRYPGGKRVRLAVHVSDDGSYDGVYLGVGGGGATGCCIDTGVRR